MCDVAGQIMTASASEDKENKDPGHPAICSFSANPCKVEEEAGCEEEAPPTSSLQIVERQEPMQTPGQNEQVQPDPTSCPSAESGRLEEPADQLPRKPWKSSKGSQDAPSSFSPNGYEILNDVEENASEAAAGTVPKLPLVVLYY
jgi:hypothetical protein